MKGIIMKSVFIVAALLVSTSVLANDVDPFGSERDAFISSKSRTEVIADLKQAQAAGQLPVVGEVGVKPEISKSTKTRAQVVAETLEAARLGLLNYGDEGPKPATAEQERQITLAGLRAIEQTATTE
jgi:hypothetical protein